MCNDTEILESENGRTLFQRFEEITSKEGCAVLPSPTPSLPFRASNNHFVGDQFHLLAREHTFLEDTFLMLLSV